MKAPILGGAYQTLSPILGNDRCVNMYPESAPSPPAKDAGALFPVAGLASKVTLSGAVVAMKACSNGKLYAVAGGNLYEITSALVVTNKGSIGTTARVTMAENGSELLISSGYLYTFVTSSLSAIADTDFKNGAVEAMDGYFLTNDPDTGIFRISNLYDGTTWDSLDFATAEGAPDNILTHIVDHREWWLFGSDTIEVWYNSGDTDFPFSRIQGAFIETGCAAADSVAKLDNGIFWLAQSSRGSVEVMRAQGYQPQRISTHAIEYAIQSYDTVSDAVAFTYSHLGHSFYVLTFPAAGKTWAYDVATGLWHERAGFASGAFTRYPANCYAYFNGLHLVGDYSNGTIYSIDETVHTFAGNTKKWLRSFRLPSAEGKRIRLNSLQLDIEAGLGLTTGQGSAPRIMLRTSKDGGKTWGSERYLDAGAVGEYSARTIARNFGVGRDWVIEYSGTDPVPINIVAGYFDGVASGS